MKVEDWDAYALSGVKLEVDDDGFPTIPEMTAQDIVERIMTQHWDLAACRCWVCAAGRDAGCRPNEGHLDYRSDVVKLPHVRVPVVRRP